MPKLPAKYKKGEVPAGLETYYTVEKDGFMCAEFEDDVALATNASLAAQNSTIIGEKRALQTKYEELVKSTGTISSELNDLRTKIASGASITTAELAIVQALKGVEGTPDEIKKRLENYSALESQVAQIAVDKENQSIALAMGWKPSIFGDLRNHPERGKGLSFAIEDVTVNGKQTKTVYVSYKNAQGVSEKTALADFVESNAEWKEFLPALKAGDQSSTTGPTWLSQQPTNTSSQTTPKSAVDAHIEARNAQAKAHANPLLPPPVTPTSPPPVTG